MTETDHGKPYTDADVETVADAIADARIRGIRNGPASMARVVLDALTAAGWQPPTRTAERCGHWVAKLIRNGTNPAITCDLPAGHDGWHRSGLAEWHEIPAQPDWSHDIAFDADGDWSIGHPDGCPGQAGGCDVERLAFDQVDAGYFNRHAGRRYRCAVNDLGDRFLLGDRIDTSQAATLAQIAAEAAQLDDDLAAGRVADRLGDHRDDEGIQFGHPRWRL